MVGAPEVMMISQSQTRLGPVSGRLGKKRDFTDYS